MPDTHKAPSYEPVKIGIVSISDRASSGTYEDKGLPACTTGSSARCTTRLLSSHA